MKFCIPSHRNSTVNISSTLTVDSQYPLTNLDSENPIDPTIWTTGTELRIVWDWTSASPQEGLVIIHHTMYEGVTLKVQANATDSWGSPSASVDVVIPAWAYIPTDNRSARSPGLGIDLRSTGLFDPGYRYTSLLIPQRGGGTAGHGLGEVWWVDEWSEPTRGIAMSSLRRSDVRRVTINSTAYGVDHVVDRHVWQRRLQFRVPVMSDADREMWFTLIREAGGDRPWPIVFETYETTDDVVETYLVRFHPDSINEIQEYLTYHGATDIEFDLLEMQRGLAL